MIHQRKLVLYGSITLLHVIALWFYRFPFPDPRFIPPTQELKPVIMAAGTEWDASIRQHPMVRDPLLMARANTRGFTGGLWNESFSSPNPFNAWHESPRYLEDPTNQWGRSMSAWLAGSTDQLWKPLTKPKASLQEPGFQPEIKPIQTSMIFSDNLRHRRPESIEALQQWEGSTLLRPTRLEIGVDGLGFVQSIRPINAASPDPVENAFIQQVIQQAKQLRFQRLPNPSAKVRQQVEWGEVIIQWGPPVIHSNVPPPDLNQGAQP